MPPITPVPIECRLAAPRAGAHERAAVTPRMNASEVMTIGRNRRRAASIAASRERLCLRGALCARELDDQDRVLRREADERHEPDLQVQMSLYEPAEPYGERTRRTRRTARRGSRRTAASSARTAPRESGTPSARPSTKIASVSSARSSSPGTTDRTRRACSRAGRRFRRDVAPSRRAPRPSCSLGAALAESACADGNTIEALDDVRARSTSLTVTMRGERHQLARARRAHRDVARCPPGCARNFASDCSWHADTRGRRG